MTLSNEMFYVTNEKGGPVRRKKTLLVASRDEKIPLEGRVDQGKPLSQGDTAEIIHLAALQVIPVQSPAPSAPLRSLPGRTPHSLVSCLLHALAMPALASAGLSFRSNVDV